VKIQQASPLNSAFRLLKKLKEPDFHRENVPASVITAVDNTGLSSRVKPEFGNDNGYRQWRI
jgi:hypothetical protein